MKKIALFASGSGTNAEQIMSTFSDHPAVQVAIVLSNKPDAFVLLRAKRFQVRTHIFDRESFYHSSEITDLLLEMDISLIVLAGFLWLIPVGLIRAFPDRIVNIHPLEF